MNDMGIEDFDDIAMLYNDYVTECDVLIQEIMHNKLSPSSTEEWIALEKDIHNIKGVSANLYVKNVYEKASDLDHYLKESLYDLPQINQLSLLWQALLEDYVLAKNEIFNFFNERK